MASAATLISITESFVTALLVQTSFYGLYIATFGVCLRWLLFADEGWRLRKPLDWPMLAATILIFACYTILLGADAWLTMESIKGFAIVPYYTYALGALTIAATDVIILVTDAVMIYRCWKVYNKSWRIAVLPVLFWLGCLISFILVFYYNYQVNALQSALQSALEAVNKTEVAQISNQFETAIAQSRNSHAALYPFNAATNIYTTTAIIYRIMRKSSEASGHSLKRLQHLCRILAETGFLYTLSTIPPLVTYFLDPVKYLIANQITTVINYYLAGISFNLVLIRVGQSRADAGDSQATDRLRLFSGQHHRHPSSSTQEQSVTMGEAEKGIISTRSALGSGGVVTHQ